MEKVKKYEKAIIQMLEYYATITSPFMPDVENIVITDTKNHHYQLQRIGRYQNRHVHYTVFHFEIFDNKVWIRENRTDLKVNEELIDFGVPAKAIVPGEHKSYKQSATQDMQLT